MKEGFLQKWLLVFEQEVDQAAEEWERKMAYAIASHEFGLVFEALAECLASGGGGDAELSSACLVAASWLAHMLSLLPDMGIRGAARVCLLKRLVDIFKSARDPYDRALAMLGLRSFMCDPEGLHDLAGHLKDIMKSLREFKKTSAMAYEMLKLLTEGQESSNDMWEYKELAQVDCSTNKLCQWSASKTR